MVRRRTRGARAMDMRTAQEAGAPPPDTWLSYGSVRRGAEQDDIVVFDEDQGMVMVRVQLEPSKTPVYARIGASATGAAGNGEGEYSTFVEGDEVLVALPGASTRQGPVIIARMNNQLDRFPMESVAGQDPTTNSFSFRRRRTPYVEEFAGPVIFRNALTGALISLDATGTATIRDGEGSAFQLSQDVVGLQGPSTPESPPRFLLQADLTGERFTVQFGGAMFSLGSELSADGGASYLTTPGAFTVAIANNQPAEHVLTLEAVISMFNVFAKGITIVGGGDPITGGAPMVALRAAIAAGGLPLDPLNTIPLTEGLQVAAAVPKPPPIAGIQMAPGLGAVFFLTG